MWYVRNYFNAHSLWPRYIWANAQLVSCSRGRCELCLNLCLPSRENIHCLKDNKIQGGSAQPTIEDRSDYNSVAAVQLLLLLTPAVLGCGWQKKNKPFSYIYIIHTALWKNVTVLLQNFSLESWIHQFPACWGRLMIFHYFLASGSSGRRYRFYCFPDFAPGNLSSSWRDFFLYCQKVMKRSGIWDSQ